MRSGLGASNAASTFIRSKCRHVLNGALQPGSVWVKSGGKLYEAIAKCHRIESICPWFFRSFLNHMEDR
ncbi:MAG: hypothetical protein PHY18_01805 [Dehalococcoidales bacterium]|nr:hypothetical protein [Dehalococcoidales bacterium]